MFQEFFSGFFNVDKKKCMTKTKNNKQLYKKLAHIIEGLGSGINIFLRENFKLFQHLQAKRKPELEFKKHNYIMSPCWQNALNCW